MGSDVKEAIVYRGYTQAELDAQYDQRTLIPQADGYRKHKDDESVRVRAKLGGLRDIAYGLSEDERLDLFMCGRPNAPTLVFVHGGAWKRGHKDDVSFVAERFVEAGANCAVLNFGIVPKVRLQEQVRQVAAAITWLWQNASRYDCDRDRLYVTGHSSGGHVTGMMLVTDWAALGVPKDIIKGAAPFSGMFDLEPVQLSWRNSYLGLTHDEALALSPIRHIPDHGAKLVIGAGGGELDEFQRQSREFAAAWRQRGYSCNEVALPGLNHKEVQELYNVPNSLIVKAIVAMMEL